MTIRLKAQDPAAQSGGTPPSLGRPASRDSRNVLEDIIHAAEICLAHKSPQEISTKEIAARAGTRPAMVYYYFGSKDGLWVEIVRRGLNEIQQVFQRTRGAIDKNRLGNPTRLLVGEFAKVWNQRPALCRILISEVFREDSQVRSYLLKQRPIPGKTMLADVIAQLSVAGYYRKDLDIESICTMINSVVLFPLIVKPYFAPDDNRLRHCLDDKWVNFVSVVFDSYLHPQKQQ